MKNMSKLKYKVGDRVLIKSIDWYNQYKDEDGVVLCGEFVFLEDMKKFCSETLTILEDVDDGYLMLEDYHGYVWTDEMFERLVERNGKTYPYKIGDRVVLKGNNRCATITDLKYNSWGNLSYYIKIDNDKDISTDYPTDLLLPYDNMVEGLVEEECPQDFIENYCKSCGTQRCDRTKEYLDGCPYYNAYMCEKQNNDMEEKETLLGWVKDYEIKQFPNKILLSQNRETGVINDYWMLQDFTDNITKEYVRLDKVYDWIKQQQDLLEDSFSDAGDFADLLIEAMEEQIYE